MEADSSNINQKWLDNIYDNIKKIEYHERLAREGCENLVEYFGIPVKIRNVFIGEAQYKNLRFFVSEFHLLLSDLTPTIEDKGLKEIIESLEAVEKFIGNRENFLKEERDINNKVTSLELKKSFYDTLMFLAGLKVKLFKEIKHILYITSSKPW